MNYPYPEVIYFTDNTPILAVMIKAVKQLFGINDIHPIFLFNLFSILNFVACSMLLFLLLKQFVKSNLLVLLGSITLAFANPQSIRYITATVNLGYGSIMVATMLLAVLLLKHRHNIPLLWKYAIITTVFTIAVSFIHLYYLVLIMVFLGPMVFFAGAYDIWQRKSARFLAVGLSICAVSFGTVMGIIRITDSFYNLRKNGANGYGWENWKLSLGGLFKSPEFFYSHFIIEPTDFIGYESMNYLGVFALYGVLVFLIVAWLRGSLRTDIKQVAGSELTKHVFYLFGITFISLFIALGPEYYLSNNELVFHNYLNVFRHAANFTDMLTHFRCLGRFGWIFFWGFNLIAFVLVDMYLSRKNSVMLLFLFVIGFYMVKDMTNTGEAYRRRINLSGLHAPNRPAYISEIAKNANATGKYDAIMVLPFFLVGSENYDRTLDGNDELCFFAMGMSDEMKLPIMSSMMSRTALPFNASMFDFYRYGKMDAELSKRLKGKRILVLKNEDMYERFPMETSAKSEQQKEAVVNSRKLPDQLNMQYMNKVDGYDMWIWRP
jgi:hypothetical protein